MRHRFPPHGTEAQCGLSPARCSAFQHRTGAACLHRGIESATGSPSQKTGASVATTNMALISHVRAMGRLRAPARDAEGEFASLGQHAGFKFVDHTVGGATLEGMWQQLENPQATQTMCPKGAAPSPPDRTRHTRMLVHTSAIAIWSGNEPKEKRGTITNELGAPGGCALLGRARQWPTKWNRQS